jgi:hypothetical protein
MLGHQGYELQANAVHTCIPGQCCHRPFCPLCQWFKALDRCAFRQDTIVSAAADYEAAFSRVLPLYSFTLTPERDPPIQGLRKVTDLMVTDLSEMIEKERKHIVGSLMIFETLPSLSLGGSAETDRPHLHGIIGFQDEASAAVDRFSSLPHFSKIKNLQSACGWVDYSCKADPDGDYSPYWKSLLRQPATFMPRIAQMKNFHVCKATGLLRMTRPRLIPSNALDGLVV